jgi:hypothetical protein
MYKRLIAASAVLGILTLVLNAVAVAFYWYVSIGWFDMLMHTLGGVFVAVLGSAFLWKYLRVLPAREFFITLALFVFVVGLAWEYYEYVVQFYIKTVHLADMMDSISDLICDMIGGCIGALFVIGLRKRYNRP